MIPWSEEGERQLRKKIGSLELAIPVTFFTGLVSFVAGLMLPHHRLWMLGGLVLFLLFVWISMLREAYETLGWEETVWRDKRHPGSGMLANKPRDTSRLTRWIALDSKKMQHGCSFQCDDCGYIFDINTMKWTANILECEEEMGDVPAVAVDPEGGRWVLICKCGVGYYVLKPAHV